VKDRRYERTTPVQRAAWPIILEGHDLVACAQTGTGKTAAFLLPLMQRLLAAGIPSTADGAPRTRVLILAPTRELAVQIEDDFQGFAYHTGLTGIAVYGGVPMHQQDVALRSGVDIIVATPGRLMDHMRSGATDFSGIQALVLDEADRMLDMGFWPDVRRIVSSLPGSAAADGADAGRQTLLFSATMPDEVMTLAHDMMREPRYVQIGRRGGPATTITHLVVRVAAQKKADWLCRFLRRASGPVLVFSRTKHGAERLARRLSTANIRAAALHADRSQSQRSAAMEGFRSGKFKVLVATDLAARGLDIDGIEHVINVEVPTTRETYVHRVGRAGRASSTGTAITLMSPEESRALASLERAFELRMVDESQSDVKDDTVRVDAPTRRESSVDASTPAAS